MSRKRNEDVRLKDALHCCCPTSGPNHQVYGRGIFVGMVSALMGTGYSFDAAYKRVSLLKPTSFDPDCDPWSPNVFEE